MADTTEPKETAEARPKVAEMRVAIGMTPGPFRREMRGYVWEEANGFIAAVDIATAAECLTYPNGSFHLVEQPPAATRRALAEAMGVRPENLVMPGETIAPAGPSVSSIAGGKRAMDLAGQGITRASQLAALDDEGIERLAAAIGASRAEVRAWVEQAK